LGHPKANSCSEDREPKSGERKEKTLIRQSCIVRRTLRFGGASYVREGKEKSDSYHSRERKRGRIEGKAFCEEEGKGEYSVAGNDGNYIAVEEEKQGE